MKKTTQACRKPDFYRKQGQGSIEESRAVLIGMYLEKELERGIQHQVEEHLQICPPCAQFLSELEKLEKFRQDSSPVLYAVCPSSEILDVYLFDPDRISAKEKEKVERHLSDCPLCKEEAAWLRQLEGQKITPLPDRSRWTPYFAVAAAVFFLLFSASLLYQYRISTPADELRVLAVIKEPDQINYESLDRTAPSLPPDLQKQYQAAIATFKKQDWSAASALFESILKERPDHSASMFLLGYTYYRMGQPEKAFALCDNAEKMQPHSLERCLSLVHIALKTGNFHRAILEIVSLYHEAPDHPEINTLYHRIMEITEGRTIKL